MLVHTHACIHSGENSRHDLYIFHRKTPILETFTVQPAIIVSVQYTCAITILLGIELFFN